MVEYLIGKFDYYKVVSIDSKRIIIISPFNLHGTLGQNSNNNQALVKIPIVELPTELVDLRMKLNSTNTVEMHLNNGWELSFRIHNASDIVEPSLKFDIQFVGVPTSIIAIERNW